jgi:hypothetical protein
MRFPWFLLALLLLPRCGCFQVRSTGDALLPALVALYEKELQLPGGEAGAEANLGKTEEKEGVARDF